MRVKARYDKSPISDEELKRATRTIIGRPVTVEFGDVIVGTVIDAVFNDGGIDLDLDLYELGLGGIDRDGRIVFTELSLVEDKSMIVSTKVSEEVEE